MYQHGISVHEHLKALIYQLEAGRIDEGWKIPTWMMDNRELLIEMIDYEEEATLYKYATFHDCGKPFCKIIDENGKQHFPNHAEKSAEIWASLGPDQNPDVIELMRGDMWIHTMKACECETFARSRHAAVWLLTGLAEIHSNAGMFGGIESTSFKIKWKHIDRRGKAIMSQIRAEKGIG